MLEDLRDAWIGLAFSCSVNNSAKNVSGQVTIFLKTLSWLQEN